MPEFQCVFLVIFKTQQQQQPQQLNPMRLFARLKHQSSRCCAIFNTFFFT